MKKTAALFLTLTMLTQLVLLSSVSVLAIAEDGFIVPVGSMPEAQTGGFVDPEPIEPPAAGSIPISNRVQLESIKTNLSGTYHLTADIDLSGSEWEPIGDSSAGFGGTFDGQGYVIRNLTVTGNYQYAGLFGYLRSGATVKNVGLAGTNINVVFGSSDFSYSYAGGICGYNIGGNIINCYNTGNISSSGSPSSNVGGICGSIINGMITDCYNIGSISSSDSSSNIGGICGYSYGENTISNCYNTGNILSAADESDLGGICGYNIDGTINNCYNTGDISASGSIVYIGGICGYGYCNKIINCYNTGDILPTAAECDAGGICGSGYNGSIIINCYNTGTVFSPAHAYSFSGGICGSVYSDSAIINCYNSGDISSPIAGGIVGYSYITITIDNCYNTGNVSSSDSSDSSNIGGICGYSNSSEIINCRNAGSVSSSSDSSDSSNIGGICGYGSSSRIINCYNTGNISSSSKSSNIGGICGYSGVDSIISTCYNIGDISSAPIPASAIFDSSIVGGICGYNYSGSNVVNCYNSGDVSSFLSISYVGGICGINNSSDVNNCYNTGNVSAVSDASSSSSIAGGICASSYSDDDDTSSTINNCYNTGDISSLASLSYIGGICGFSDGTSTIENCYWNVDASQTSKGTELTNASKKGVGDGTDTSNSLEMPQMKERSYFIGFDFGSVWKIEPTVNNGYPYFIHSVGTITYTIAAIAESGGTATITGSGTYNADDTVTMVASPNEGYEFDGWYEYNIKAGEDETYSFRATADRTIKANFTSIVTYRVTAAAGKGGTVTITGDGMYNSGDVVRLTASPDENYKFDGWYEDDNLISTENIYTFIATADREFEARFTDLYIYTVAVTAGTGGNVTITGDGTYGADDAVTVAAVPDEDYEFDGWYENNSLISTESMYTFIATADRELEARFTSIYIYTVTVTAGTGGTVTITGDGVYKADDIVTATAAPDEDYEFDGWYENDNLISTESIYTFIAAMDRELEAKFSSSYIYAVSLTSSAGGTVAITGDGRIYKADDIVTATAFPDEDYEFGGWYENDKLISTEDVYTFIVTADRELEARFATEETDIEVIMQKIREEFASAYAEAYAANGSKPLTRPEIVSLLTQVIEKYAQYVK